MKLTNLQKTTVRSKKRVGRGVGSGKGGHTAGRGTKGQKSRNKVPLYFTGSAMGASLIKQLPLMRGKGKLKPSKRKPIGVNIKYLNILPAKSVVDIALLIKHHVVDMREAQKYGVKLLGDGNLEVALTVTLPVTKGARKKIEDAGGSVK